MNAPWHAVHVVLPLAIPAAVALAAVARRALGAVHDRDVAVAGVAVFVCCVVLAVPLTTAAGTAYLHPQSQDNALVQYGQPSDDVRDTLDDVEAAAAANTDGPDVVYYGAYFYVDNPQRVDRLPVGDVYTENDDGGYDLVEANEGWYNRLPLPWYTEAFEATTDSARDRDGLADLAATDPPVVVVRSQLAANVSTVLGSGYDRTTFNLTQGNVTVTVFVDRDAATQPRVDRDAATQPRVDRDAATQHGIDAPPGGVAKSSAFASAASESPRDATPRDAANATVRHAESTPDPAVVARTQRGIVKRGPPVSLA